MEVPLGQGESLDDDVWRATFPTSPPAMLDVAGINLPMAGLGSWLGFLASRLLLEIDNKFSPRKGSTISMLQVLSLEN